MEWLILMINSHPKVHISYITFQWNWIISGLNVRHWWTKLREKQGTYIWFTISDKEITFNSALIEQSFALISRYCSEIPFLRSVRSGQCRTSIDTICLDFDIIGWDKANLSVRISGSPPFWIVKWMFYNFEDFTLSEWKFFCILSIKII